MSLHRFGAAERWRRPCVAGIGAATQGGGPGIGALGQPIPAGERLRQVLHRHEVRVPAVQDGLDTGR